MRTPCLQVEDDGQVLHLEKEVTTVGRGEGVDLSLSSPTVSRLHAELVRRGPHVYVADEGLSANGTTVNGRPVWKRVLRDGDVVMFGRVRCVFTGTPDEEEVPGTAQVRRAALPDLTRRERDVLQALVEPALGHAAFVEPASAKDIAERLVVTEAAVKQHLLRLYGKFRVPEGQGRRQRLANEVLASGAVRPVRLTREPGRGGGDAQSDDDQS